jgi:hypothetical protein
MLRAYFCTGTCTIFFDRGGWSPKLSAAMIKGGFDDAVRHLLDAAIPMHQMEVLEEPALLGTRDVCTRCLASWRECCSAELSKVAVIRPPQHRRAQR